MENKEIIFTISAGSAKKAKAEGRPFEPLGTFGTYEEASQRARLYMSEEKRNFVFLQSWEGEALKKEYTLRRSPYEGDGTIEGEQKEISHFIKRYEKRQEYIAKKKAERGEK